MAGGGQCVQQPASKASRGTLRSRSFGLGVNSRLVPAERTAGHGLAGDFRCKRVNRGRIDAGLKVKVGFSDTDFVSVRI